jgi:hypothetical protein
VPEIKPEQLLLIAGFILPGAISIFIYGLKVPQREFALKDRIVEAICFSMLNFVVVWPLLQAMLGQPSVQARFWLEWLLVFCGFVIAPAAWPFLLVRLLRLAERRGWIAVRARTAWDDFFSRQQRGFWIQVELTDGRLVGGRFDMRSYASAYPEPGHLYIEELWNIDRGGYFITKMVGGPGVLLRPTGYRLVRVFVGVGDE